MPSTELAVPTAKSPSRLRRATANVAAWLGFGRKGWSQPPFWSLERPLWLPPSSPDREAIGNDYEGYIRGAYKASGVVYACAVTRASIFGEARFAWRERAVNGRPELSRTDELALLEDPWPNGTTGELLARMIQDVDLAGNFYATVVDDEGRIGKAVTGPGRRITRLRPDWVTIVIGSKLGNPYAIDARVVAYIYKPPTYRGEVTETILLPDQVCHFSPDPDPEARFRGMSWITPVVREIEADKSATKHKLKFFTNGAKLSTLVSLDKDIQPEAFDQFVTMFRKQHEGVDVAYKTLFIGGGADVTALTADLKAIDFKNVQGAGETRIAAAAGVHPVIVGLSEGLQGSSLNAGNFQAARRLTADKTMRPLWRKAAAALRSLVDVPAGQELWYDDRDIAFLREDMKDLAETQGMESRTIRTLLDSGYEADSVVAAVVTQDWTLLTHSGRPSVQLQSGTTTEPPADPGNDDTEENGDAEDAA